jgi:hypothetical protein
MNERGAIVNELDGFCEIDRCSWLVRRLVERGEFLALEAEDTTSPVLR